MGPPPGDHRAVLAQRRDGARRCATPCWRKFEAIELPPGYRLDWDGEYWSAKQSQEALTPGIVPAVVIMLFILVALFNGFRPMLICILVIPFVMIGITAGLLLTSTPFGFIALLGAMSLSGMMIKNVVVLLGRGQCESRQGARSRTTRSSRRRCPA